MLQKVFNKSTMLVMVIGLLLIGIARPAQAYANCEQKIRRAERNLEKAIQRHGVHSVEAERQRDKLERARARCNR